MAVGAIPTIRDEKVAAGPELTVGDRVSVLYKIADTKDALRAGPWFETTFAPDTPVVVCFHPDYLLTGVYQGMRGMRAGGSIRYIHVPSALAYGCRCFGAIPANSDLHLEITVISIESRA